MEKNKIGKKIKQLRKLAGLTMGQLAEKINVRYQVISRIESGDTKFPNGNNLYKLAKVLNTTVEFIMEGKGFSNIKNVKENKIPLLLNSKEIIEWCQNDIKNISHYNRPYIHNPFINRQPDNFIIEILSDSMQGKYHAGIPKGAIAICRPSSKIIQNSYSIFYDKEQEEIFIREVIIDGKTYLKPLNNQFKIEEITDNIEPIAEIIAYLVSFIKISN